MARIRYRYLGFKPKSLQLIKKIDQICTTYAASGLVLTVRQLFYRLISNGHIENTVKAYDSLVNLVNNARLAGMLDWDHIEDRTRNLYGNEHWNNVRHAIDDAHDKFMLNRWEGQDNYCEVWVEKQALEGVIARAATRLDVYYLCCRGYLSQSEMHAAAQRFRYYEEQLNRQTFVIYLGDHDPSGIDMSRDIQDRLEMFEANTSVNRVALNFNQVQQFDLIPNPAKVTDSRFVGYQEEFGNESWELDALEPAVLDELIEDTVFTYLDRDVYDARIKEEEKDRTLLKALTNNWTEVEGYVSEKFINEDEETGYEDYRINDEEDEEEEEDEYEE